METCKTKSRFGLGIILIAIGLIFFAGNFGLIDQALYRILTRWPMILVAIGFLNLFKRQYIPAIILFAVASYFMLPEIVPALSQREILRYWPLLLVLVGVLFLFRPNRINVPIKAEIASNSQDVIDDVAVFGGSVSQIESQNFRGGKITAVFGGSEIHFANSRMVDEGAVIDLAAVFGGVKIVVPRDWNVRVEVVSIFGGFADKRLYVANENPSTKTLLIKGMAIFGGGELSNS